MGYYSTHNLAVDAGKGKNGYGGNCEVITVKAIFIDNKYYLLESITPIDVDNEHAKKDEKIRKEALSLLSDEHKRVLGLK